jgi:hypothetical protein
MVSDAPGFCVTFTFPVLLLSEMKPYGCGHVDTYMLGNFSVVKLYLYIQ